MMRRSLIIVTSLACLALGWPCAADDITSPIVGLWKLTGTTTKNVATGAMERPYGERPSGYQLFTKGGRMLFISVAENRKPPSARVPTTEERAAFFDAFIAYGGTYKIDGSKVLVHIDTHTVPPFPETVDRTYTMEINGDKLTLTSAPFVAGTTGQPMISIRTFERAE
jgi:Lipocalin-like domain